MRTQLDQLQAETPRGHNTAHAYLAGIGASGAVLTAAVVGFVLLVGVVSFDVWPQASDEPGAGPPFELSVPGDQASDLPPDLASAAGLLASASPLGDAGATPELGDGLGALGPAPGAEGAPEGTGPAGGGSGGGGGGAGVDEGGPDDDGSDGDGRPGDDSDDGIPPVVNPPGGTGNGAGTPGRGPRGPRGGDDGGHHHSGGNGSTNDGSGDRDDHDHITGSRDDDDSRSGGSHGGYGSREGNGDDSRGGYQSRGSSDSAQGYSRGSNRGRSRR